MSRKRTLKSTAIGESEAASQYFVSTVTKTRAGAKKLQAKIEEPPPKVSKINSAQLKQNLSQPKGKRKKEAVNTENTVPEAGNGTSHDLVKIEKLDDIEDIGRWQPPKWAEVVSLIRTMRAGRDAPVDSMGCDQCADASAPEPTQRLHHLLSLMLSSQTKDQVTFAAMGRLRAIPGGLSIETLLALSDDELGKLIHPVGFWRSKAKYIKATCLLLKDKFDSDIPNTVEGLCSLPGVGPKMAHLCMQAAWGTVSGIGVDTHVHRISNRLGWVRNAKKPEKTRTELESWLPKDLWREVNHLLVGFGQTICKPVGPNCSECLAKEICPSAGKTKKAIKRNSCHKLGLIYNRRGTPRHVWLLGPKLGNFVDLP